MKSIKNRQTLISVVEGAATQWLVLSTQYQQVRVQSLPGAFCCVFGQDTELSQASLYRGIEMGTGEYITGGNPAMDWHPVQKGGAGGGGGAVTDVGKSYRTCIAGNTSCSSWVITHLA